jgi:hypothetical protein
MPDAAQGRFLPLGRAKSNAPGLTMIRDWSRTPLGNPNLDFGLW